MDGDCNRRCCQTRETVGQWTDTRGSGTVSFLAVHAASHVSRRVSCSSVGFQTAMTARDSLICCDLYSRLQIARFGLFLMARLIYLNDKVTPNTDNIIIIIPFLFSRVGKGL